VLRGVGEKGGEARLGGAKWGLWRSEGREERERAQSKCESLKAGEEGDGEGEGRVGVKIKVGERRVEGGDGRD